MIYNQYNKKLLSLTSFDTELRWIYKDPALLTPEASGPTPDGVHVCIDTSGSMKAKHKVLKQIIGSVAAMCGLIGQLNTCPTLDGKATHIASNVGELAGVIGEGQKLVVVTDGGDNEMNLDLSKLVVDINNGTPVYSQLPQKAVHPPAPPDDATAEERQEHMRECALAQKTWTDNRQSDILRHIENVVRAELVLVAVGDEVAPFIVKASRVMKRTSLAHVPTAASLQAVTGIVTAAVRAPRVQQEQAEPLKVLRIDAPEAQPAAQGITPQIQEAIDQHANAITVDTSITRSGADLTPAQIRTLIEAVENEPADEHGNPSEITKMLAHVDRLKFRTQLLYFLQECAKKPGERLPGALIGSENKAVLTGIALEGTLESNARTLANKLLSKLGTKGELLMPHTKDSMEVELTVAGHAPYKGTFNACAVYAAGPRLKPKNVQKLMDDSTFAAPMADLTRTNNGTGKGKRKRD